MKYRIVHHYLTLGNDGQPVVETEEWPGHGEPRNAVDDIEDVLMLVEGALRLPGGRSGTTITLTVTALDDVTV